MSKFTYNQAVEEASKCLLCYDAPCSNGCPANTNPSKFIRSIRFNNLKGSAKTIRTNNILGGICARVCPYDQLCQENCIRAEIDESIKIGKLQEFVCDYEKEHNLKVLEPVELEKEKIAIIGSGPAGLAAAGELALSGYKVKVFEKRSLVGGWLNYGIPASKLPQKIVNEEINYIRDLGVEFETNCEVGKDISLDELKERGYKVFLMALGKPNPKVLDLEGSQLDGVTDAVSFLSESKTKPEKFDVKNKKIVIIGGGDVAIDCAITAKENKAAKVNIVCIETLAEIPCTEKELHKAYNKNVNVFAGFKPEAIKGENKVERFTAVSVEDNSTLELECENIIFAVGQKSDDVKKIEDLKLDQDGFIKTDENLKTNKKNIFAAGDIIKTDNTVVNAIADGKEVAENIINYIINKKEKEQVRI
ncbi:MAG: FAD-dependent oxidoreductase [Halanaerobium sp.]